MSEVIENVAQAIKDESGAYTVSSAKNSRGERGFYVRRRDSGEDFEPIAGPFSTDAEADAEIARIIGRAAIEAYEAAKAQERAKWAQLKQPSILERPY